MQAAALPLSSPCWILNGDKWLSGTVAGHYTKDGLDMTMVRVHGRKCGYEVRPNDLVSTERDVPLGFSRPDDDAAGAITDMMLGMR